MDAKTYKAQKQAYLAAKSVTSFAAKPIESHPGQPAGFTIECTPASPVFAALVIGLLNDPTFQATVITKVGNRADKFLVEEKVKFLAEQEKDLLDERNDLTVKIGI